MQAMAEMAVAAAMAEVALVLVLPEAPVVPDKAVARAGWHPRRPSLQLMEASSVPVPLISMFQRQASVAATAATAETAASVLMSLEQPVLQAMGVMAV